METQSLCSRSNLAANLSDPGVQCPEQILQDQPESKRSAETNHPDVPGTRTSQPRVASNGESCLSTAQTSGKASRAIRPRILKIEETGDFYNGKVRPRIRLSDRWLERAGFKPGHRVQVEWIEAGVLSLRFIQVVKPTE
jgi:hypothetical protein